MLMKYLSVDILSNKIAKPNICLINYLPQNVLNHKYSGPSNQSFYSIHWPTK